MTLPEGLQVLVLDADMVPALTIARSLLRRKCQVDIASHVERPLASYSRNIRAVYRHPDALAAVHCKSRHYDLVIPVTERSLTPLSGSRERFEHVKIAMPSTDSLEVVLDKSQTLALATRLGVAVPAGVTVNSVDEVAALQDSLRYPVVLKPARSIGVREGGASHLQVSYAFDPIGLITGCSHALRFGPVLLQEYFSGDGVGVELIARSGEIAYAFEASRRLIRALDWNGVAMVEFKLNRSSGEYCLMEINGRFWGSLPLASAAGADFPAMLLELELTGSITPGGAYRNGIYCRLLSRDLMWYESVLRGGEDARIAHVPSRWEVLKGLGLFLHPRHRFDVQALRDPRPGLVDLGRIISRYCQRLSGVVRHDWFLLGQKIAWRRGKVNAALSTANTILFLCYGNINRSALADALVRGYAADAAGVRVCSAGFHPQEGRPADPVMQEIAAESGLDMHKQRSSMLTAELLASSDIIFVMEKRHYDRLVEQAPELAGKIFLLGAHPSERKQSAEIEDPFGLPREAYLHCYARIAEAIDHVKAIVATRSAE